MDNLYDSLEQQFNLPPGSLNAIYTAEGQPTADTVSPKGAKGWFQWTDNTAKAYNVDPTDKVSAATGTAKYLADLTKQYGSFQAAVAHYNGGTKAGEAVAAGKQPPANETQKYLQTVNSNLRTPDPSNIDWENAPTETPNPANIDWEQPAAPSVQAKPAATPTGTPLEQFGRGALQSVRDIGLGAKQLLDYPATALESYFGQQSPIGKFGAALGMPTAAQSAAQTQQDIEAQRKASEEFMGTLPGQLGYAAGNIGTTLAGGAALKGAGMLGTATNAPIAAGLGEAMLNPNTYKSAIGLGMAQGALTPTLDQENKGFNTLVGGVLGGLGLGAVNAAGRVAKPFANTLSDIGQKSVQVLKDAGVPLDAAQTTGSALLTRVKASLSDNPLTVGGQNAFTQMQQTAYNKAIAKTFGEEASHIEPAVIQSAKDRIGNDYDTVAQRVNIDANQGFRNDLRNIQQESGLILKPEQQSIIEKNIDDILNKADANNGVLNFDQYKNVKKTLDRLSASSDSDVAGYARELRDALNRGLSSTATAQNDQEAVKMLKTADRQWGNMRKVEDVVIKNPEGDISPSLLFNSLATKAKRHSFYQDDPELAQLATAGKVILPNKTPNSGTVARLMAASLPAAAGGIAGAAYQGDITGAAQGLAAGVLLPKAAQYLMNNPNAANYLSQGISSAPLRNILQLPQNVQAQRLAPALSMGYLQSQPAKR
jgi:hypothetical protein